MAQTHPRFAGTQPGTGRLETVRTLAVYSIKGGVGKTVSAVNLAYLASLHGARVLVCDLDPQGATTFYLRVRAKLKGGGRGLVKGRRALPDLIKHTELRGLDVLPADFSFRNLDVRLAETDKPERRLRKLLRPLHTIYDYAFLDCPPGITLLSENVFHASDALLSPMIPTTLSLRTHEQLQRFLRRKKLEALPVWPFFTLVDSRKRLHRETVADFVQVVPQTLGCWIPYASDVERMGEVRAPLPAFAGKSASGIAYRNLWREVENRLAAAAHDAGPSAGAGIDRALPALGLHRRPRPVA